MKKNDIITEIRGFNRFYTNILGLLDQHIIDSGYSLTEARILFEISKTDTCTANQLCSVLDIDRSYMSKIISKFEKKELIKRSVCDTDNRNIEIHMTEKGMTVFHELNDHANKQIDDLISKLTSGECEKLIDSIRTVSAQESARILYKNAGFVITETSENENWGAPVLEEKWNLDL